MPIIWSIQPKFRVLAKLWTFMPKIWCWLPIYVIVNILKWDIFFLWQNLRHDNDLTSEICDIYSATIFVAILFTYVVKTWQSRGFCQSCKFQEPKLSIIIDLPIFLSFWFYAEKIPCFGMHRCCGRNPSSHSIFFVTWMMKHNDFSNSSTNSILRWKWRRTLGFFLLP